MVMLAAAVPQLAIAVLSFCVNDWFKCCCTTTTDSAVEPSGNDDDEVDGIEDVHLNVTLTPR